ncbi:MAG TPA: ABC transporter permease [Candidatus Limnocylindria bacterium]|jgi:putative ABC transport system permease protein|nr:ABC transporter permease [Candidatus Limnocylindria bacterium]
MNDLRLAYRHLLKSPGYTCVALCLLALGIGANTALFSFVNSVLLRPLPYPKADRLVAVCESNPTLGWQNYVASVGAFADWRDQNTTFQELAGAMVLGPLAIGNESGSDMVSLASVSANFFPLLGISPLIGRSFLPEEEAPGAGNVVLLGENLWRKRFGADPSLLNKSIRLGDRSVTVVGIMPATLSLFDPVGVEGWDSGFTKCEVWRPLPVNSGLKNQRSYRVLLVLGRLKPGISLAQAQLDLAALARLQAQAYPGSNQGWGATVEPWRKVVVRGARTPMLLLLGAVGLVLLIAAANLASLNLSRFTARQREFSVRVALGEGRYRMVRQLLTESLMLSGLGGVFGLLLAEWCLRVLIRIIPSDLPRADTVGLDGWVLGFTFTISVVVGVVFGLAPAFVFKPGEMAGWLKSDARGTAGSLGGRRLRGWLVASQVALVTILLSGAGLMARSFWRLSVVDPGFRADRLQAVDVSIIGGAYTNGMVRIRAVDSLLASLYNKWGEGNVAAVDGLPLDPGRGNRDIALTAPDGNLKVDPTQKAVAGLRLISPGYFRLMGIPLASGRHFDAGDRAESAPAVIVNEAFVRRYWRDGSPLGQRISSPDFGDLPCTIVGVVRDVKHTSLDSEVGPEVFRPLSQECFSTFSVVMRSTSDAGGVPNIIRDALGGVDRSWPVYNVRPLKGLVDESLGARRFGLVLVMLFSGLALLIALVGVYGLLSCVIAERTREIGIRMAMGAQRSRIQRMVLMEGMRTVAAGAVVGLSSAIALERLLAGFLYQIHPGDPVTMLAVIGLLAGGAVMACWLPACRATRVDPMVALRGD